ncbi:MAG TPA: GxGYxYP family putative glycoside hydrolase [Candidatus Hydrogenedens sp.]|nr:GxGYxYP family putative glycoside hydrolase [Candidatus Hydrogenedens sp.]
MLFFLSLLILAPPFAISEPMPIYYYDFSWSTEKDMNTENNARDAWDTGHLLASLQGIVNRAEPRLFVRFMKETDDFWWNEFRKSGGWLDKKEVKQVDDWITLLNVFHPFIEGIVIYSEKVQPSSNLASTIAGLENRICLRYDTSNESAFQKVIATNLPFTKNLRWLVNNETLEILPTIKPKDYSDISSVSLKARSYLWAKEQFLDTGLCSPEFLAYYIDGYWFQKPSSASFPNATLMNHDFFISRRAFFFDLGIWDDEPANDEPQQPAGTDRKILREILLSMYRNAKGMIYQIGGFTPWIWKYTKEAGMGGKHEGVPTEWEFVKMVSSFNGVLDADALGLAGMANASFYQHYPLKSFYPQNQKPTFENLKQQGYITSDGKVAPKVYVCFYMGDFDSAAWLNQTVPKWWSDPAHGEITCIFPFNPNLSRRVPHVFDYVRTHASPKDWFVYGDCGAGYLNPGMLIASHREYGIPAGWNAWVEHNLFYSKRFDLSITGFIIDGYAPGLDKDGFEAYSRFSPDGITAQKISSLGCYEKKLPYVRMGIDLMEPPEKSSDIIAEYAKKPLPSFRFIRTILKSPTWHKTVIDLTQQKTDTVAFVDPYTFFELVKIQTQCFPSS